MAKALEEAGKTCFLTREPGGPPISEAIRSILLNPQTPEMLPETELLLYMASRSQHTGQWILPALNQAKIVISDRYNDSTIAYQGAARNLNQRFISTLAKFATFHTTPDLTILIDLPVEEGLKRIQNRTLDRLELESIRFHRKVRSQYLSIAKKQPHRYLVIDGQKSPQQIHEIIKNSVFALIGV